MKLYSRGQLVRYTAAFTVGALAIALVVALVIVPTVRGSKRAPQSSPQEAVHTQQTASESVPFQLETDVIPAQRPSTTNGSARFSADELQNIEIYQRLNAGVVNISTETLALNWFLEPVPEGGGIGSGSIIDRRGYVLTNYHVVEKAYKVTITLADGTQFPGKVIGSDPESDLAIIKFDPGDKKLVTIPLGSSADLRVGQKVLAIGNPFGLNRTLTEGIVSGLGRPIRADNGLIMRDMIQTDASINPGNSGGPLLDSQGEMIGINTMIYTPSGGSVGIGFATPVDTARRIVPELIKYGMVRRGWIDLVPVQLDPNIVRYASLPVSKGLLVSKVVKGGNAEQAGIRGGDQRNPVRYGQSIIYFGGDIITNINNTPVTSIADLFSSLEDTKPGETVPVEVDRNGQMLTFQVTLDERPKGLKWE